MSKIIDKSKLVVKGKIKKIESWQDAIEYAQQRIRALEYSISVFRQKQEAGEPWSVKSATHN